MPTQVQEGYLPRFSIHALASHQAIGVVTFARGRVVGMSSSDIHDAKNSAVSKYPQGWARIIMALQNENNAKNELPGQKINNLRNPLRLI
jgi:hypothetical protein